VTSAALVLALVASFSGRAVAVQDTAATAPGPSMASLLDSIKKSSPGTVSTSGVFGLSSDCGSFGDDSTKALCWRAYREYFAYYQSGFAHRRRVFWWQHLSTRIIFAVVLALVSAGILFAWIQFRKDLVAAALSGGVPGTASQVEIGTTGVKVSSPVLGVIILVISLAFFYLYLVFVYPIKEIL